MVGGGGRRRRWDLSASALEGARAANQGERMHRLDQLDGAAREDALMRMLPEQQALFDGAGDGSHDDDVYPRRRTLGRQPKHASIGNIFSGLGSGGGSKMIFIFVGLMLVRLMMSRQSDDSVKVLPRQYRQIVDAWSNHTFEPGIFEAKGAQRELLVNLSTGRWARTHRLRKQLKKNNATKKAVAMEKGGTRVLVVPKLLSEDDCAAIVAASQGDGFSADLGQDGLGFTGDQSWKTPQRAGEYRDHAIVALEEAITELTNLSAHPNEGPIAVGRLGVEATFDTWKSSLQWPIARTPSLLLTVVVFLGGGDARGGDLLLPTFGKSDRKFRNVSMTLLNTTDKSMPVVGLDLDDELQRCNSVECKKHRLTHQALKLCKTQSFKTRSRRGLKTLRNGLVIPAHNGTVALIYHRIRSGYPDPESWYMHCPFVRANETIPSDPMWVAVKQKVLPVTGTLPHSWVEGAADVDDTCAGDTC